MADASSGVASFPVTVAFDDTSGEIHAGSTVNVEITVTELADVVQVPSFTVHTTDGQPSVTVPWRRWRSNSGRTKENSRSQDHLRQKRNRHATR